MTEVVLREGESQESLIRRFRQKVVASGVLEDARHRQYFISKRTACRIRARRKR